MTTSYSNQPANWYPDPAITGHERWWDGQAWTDHVRPTGMPPAYAQPVAEAGNGFSITGIVFGVIALLFLPILFGPLGLIMGAVGKSKNESLATVALIVAGLGMVLGMVIGAVVAAALL